jgi:pre-rRNA-processing protein TSR4
MADEDFDESLHGDDEEGEIDTGVQLGFVSDSRNLMFIDSNWEKWDGGKVGGKPTWLDPIRIPHHADLQCKSCNSPMIFLLQIYCPLDEVERAFHRALYVFVCRKKSCVNKGSVKCFRSQLGRKNDIYPYESKSVSKEGTVVVNKSIPKLCTLCGCRAPSVCSKCKLVSYCSREHQAADWKDHKRYCSELSKETEMTLNINNLTFPEFDLSISAEILEDLSKVDALNKSVLEASIWENASAVEVDDCSDDEDEKDDAALTQTDYNTALGNEAADSVYTKFMERVRRGGSNQVLRYSRWDDIEGPLTLSSADVRTSPNIGQIECNDTADCCVNCGAKRRFEFQIMPQLLHFLRVDRRTKLAKSSSENISDSPLAQESPSLLKVEGEISDEAEVVESCLLQNRTEEDLDWGTIDVYTCTESCSAKGSEPNDSACIEEVTYVQRPLSFVRSAVM